MQPIWKLVGFADWASDKQAALDESRKVLRVARIVIPSTLRQPAIQPVPHQAVKSFRGRVDQLRIVEQRLDPGNTIEHGPYSLGRTNRIATAGGHQRRRPQP